MEEAAKNILSSVTQSAIKATVRDYISTLGTNEPINQVLKYSTLPIMQIQPQELQVVQFVLNIVRKFM